MAKHGRKGTAESRSIDVHVGQRVRLRRTLLGMSQTQLGQALGLTFQQIQKYERGTNRISAGVLYRLGAVLDIPVSFFFDCYEGEGAAKVVSGSESSGSEHADLSRREGRLLRYWRQAPEPVANQVLELLTTLAKRMAAAAAVDESDEEEGDGEGTGSKTVTRRSRAPSDKLAALSEAAPPAEPRVPARPAAESRPSLRAWTPPSADDTSDSPSRRRRGAVWDPADIRET